MSDKILEHIDRLPLYEKVREKIISLSQGQSSEASILQVDEELAEYDEDSGRSWQWVDAPAGVSLRDEDPDQRSEEINAVDGGCYNCGGRGHLARDCPSARREKGKGKQQKGKGKGKGKEGKGPGGPAGKGPVGPGAGKRCETCEGVATHQRHALSRIRN